MQLFVISSSWSEPRIYLDYVIILSHIAPISTFIIQLKISLLPMKCTTPSCLIVTMVYLLTSAMVAKPPSEPAPLARLLIKRLYFKGHLGISNYETLIGVTLSQLQLCYTTTSCSTEQLASNRLSFTSLTARTYSLPKVDGILVSDWLIQHPKIGCRKLRFPAHSCSKSRSIVTPTGKDTGNKRVYQPRPPRLVAGLRHVYSNTFASGTTHQKFGYIGQPMRNKTRLIFPRLFIRRRQEA